MLPQTARAHSLGRWQQAEKKKEKDIDITKETENLKNMKEILKRIESNKLLLSVQNDLFEKEAILNASYKFTNKCYIYIEQNDSFTEIYFQSKDENDDLELIALNFNNELLDQQVRLNTGREFKGIREELVRKAFSTVTKKQ